MDELDRLVNAIRTQPGIDSPASWLASHSTAVQQLLTSLSDEDVVRLEFLWEFWARPEQLP